jgi:ABC-type protease/lipase transport system fused ATPase/permease subunit
MLISKAVSPLQKLIGGWKDIVAARQAYDRLNELLSQDMQLKKGMKLPAPVGRLTVEEAVGVPPGHDKAVISDINITLEPGQVLAVVGPSAAGKTSLVKLLMGVWAPVRGKSSAPSMASASAPATALWKKWSWH